MITVKVFKNTLKNHYVHTQFRQKSDNFRKENMLEGKVSHQPRTKSAAENSIQYYFQTTAVIVGFKMKWATATTVLN